MGSHLIYVVGASGSGKDTLMGYARQKLAGDPRVCFAHRYITRCATAGGENHVALTPQEFTSRENGKLFAMHWSSHGMHYGIGIEINQWLAKGITVVINGSREYLEEARQRYPELLPVTIDVATDVLRARLLARGREDAASVEQRLRRHETLQRQPLPGVRIQNNGLVEAAGDELVRLIAAHTQGVATCV
ncbi:phosphonate metabolism protein/1,5-bisphosphokinase (PRPP-forming) PhnN [Hydrogenophaga sp.]|uniref:phosphonate metabolism protein/1,5-bisphosphokinase (PRPP-forming) PhnN n=1 Tax=Hydrogenophaga sp. TaxID=1904254 RepID=UPI00273737A1|nr:phosphonate metabolism protein/1,5-bisphosphokinase (PRPP-forming) PhnN [Hydrogenophaga sp.]MDP3887482.1 phosphonate metabolism protein/1,5-bisphosphokinase (PRPP-forming) PhnN [Hydrogenophaga sp.]